MYLILFLKVGVDFLLNLRKIHPIGFFPFFFLLLFPHLASENDFWTNFYAEVFSIFVHAWIDTRHWKHCLFCCFFVRRGWQTCRRHCCITSIHEAKRTSTVHEFSHSSSSTSSFLFYQPRPEAHTPTTMCAPSFIVVMLCGLRTQAISPPDTPIVLFHALWSWLKGIRHATAVTCTVMNLNGGLTVWSDLVVMAC